MIEDPPEIQILSARRRMARKPRECFACRKQIAPGETYTAYAYLDHENKFTTDACHYNCEERLCPPE